jgi:hypothetical protein
VSLLNILAPFFYLNPLEDVGDAVDAYQEECSVLIFLLVHPAKLLAVIALAEYWISQALWHVVLLSQDRRPSPFAVAPHPWGDAAYHTLNSFARELFLAQL